MKIFTSSKPCFTPPHAGFTALFAVIFTFLSFNVFSQSGQKFASGGNSLSTGEFLGSINNYPLLFKVNNVLGMSLTPTGYLGATTMFFEVKGDGKIVNFNVLSNLSVGNILSVAKVISPNGQVDFDGSKLLTSSGVTCNKLILTGTSNHITASGGTVSFDGNNIITTAAINSGSLNVTNEIIAGVVTTPKIWSASGLINFDGCNLITTADIMSANLTISGIGTFGSISANSFQNPLFVGTSSGLLLSDTNGSFQKLNFDGNQNTYLRGDGTFGFMPVNDAWKTVNGNIYTTGNFNVGIGIDSPIEKLDVNGNANIRGYLYVQDGVIIGKRITSEKVTSDTISTSKLEAIEKISTNRFVGRTLLVEKVTADTLKTDNMSLLLMQADSITAQKMTLDKLATSEINATGPITSKAINIGEQAKIGTNIIINGLTNNITTPGEVTAGSFNTGNIRIIGNTSTIQSSSGKISFENSNLSTTGNIFAGNVGIGIENPIEKLDVAGNANIRGYLYVQDGVIIGQRIYSDEVNTRRLFADTMNTGKITTDTLNVKEIITDSLSLVKLDISSLIKAKNIESVRMDGQIFKSDSLSSLKVTTETLSSRLINADGDIGTGWKITINGTNNTITSTFPTIGFGSNNLKTTGDITAGSIAAETMNVTNVIVDSSVVNSMQVVDELIIGSNSLHLSSSDIPNGDGTSIYSTNGNLRLQSLNENTFHTILNAGTNNTGNVGIGNYFPTEKLDVNGNLKVSGNITAVNIDVLSQSINYLNVVNGIKVGSSSIILGEFMQNGAANNIFTETDNLFIQSNTTSANHTIINNNSGYVGIGTDNPGKKLHIKTSETGINDGTGDTGTGGGNDYTGSVRIEHELTGITSSIWDLEPIISPGPGFNTRFSIGIPDHTEMFTILSNGSVGIGTSTPTATLEVNGTFKLTDGVTHSAGDVLTYDSTGNAIWKTPVLFTEKWQPATNPDDIYFGSSTTGNVGIGTNAPISKFQVGSEGSKICLGDGFTVGINPTTYWNASYIGFNAGRDYNNNKWIFDWDGAHNGGSAILSTINGDLRFVHVPSQSDAHYKQELTDAELLDKTKMIITGNGNVGIGTSNPFEKLEIGGNNNLCFKASSDIPNDAGDIIFKNNSDVTKARIWTNNSITTGLFFNGGKLNGTSPSIDLSINENGNIGIGTTITDYAKLTVKGIIRAEDVFIKADVDVPDYVFTKDYDLRTLTEVENYVIENHHLPEIPSAKDFEKDGHDLGRMDMLLLKKVEELSLYLIEQNKQIEALKKQIQNLTK